MQSGTQILERTVRAFGGADTSRYNMIGGSPAESQAQLSSLPPSDKANQRHQNTTGALVGLYILPHDATILTTRLDYLPWTSLPWFIHRGLQDILVFVRDGNMADMAAGAVLAGGGNSGRIVTDIAVVWCEGHRDMRSYDGTISWGVEPPPTPPTSPSFFVLRWSVESDDEVYHDSLLEIRFGVLSSAFCVRGRVIE
ncbi:uncharacterized protein BO80DRAFT_489868 [Aspergillus ibericus CBS 121593]|uniref:Uncharacterized protein n=1 Tax=Aspergillus ibericus CBS 121593 TaxID=1448316 RepID=A0A395HEU8_9EURO|nr:hypothetical protein BO80DRAFT_489868 [Aspergillus ibericus CBS 121593]RAL06367.1 hypothetical protein BO80DRAFT_489868 [Aspergillus ibericus CBS 121593]